MSLAGDSKKEKKMKSLADLNTPIFWAEGHPGSLVRENWKIEVSGNCQNPHTFTWKELMNLPKTEVDARLTSVTRWSVRGIWGGVKLSDIFAIVKPNSSVKYVRIWSVYEVYDTSISMETALEERTLIAWEFNSKLLTEDYGGPVRLFCPYLWGYKSAKSIVKIELMDYYVPGYWEKRGYTDSGEIEAGKMRDINEGGKVKTIPAGEVIDFKEDKR
jgi:DMSO/TMAO reductase YedYZ molybdopterin-dependent catalytic subunit